VFIVGNRCSSLEQVTERVFVVGNRCSSSGTGVRRREQVFVAGTGPSDRWCRRSLEEPGVRC
jgi:hypothetical protein